MALIHGRGPGATVGLRADMDALPMAEATGVEHASQRLGAMHACGHDGHTAMLLGAANHLAQTRSFDGTVALIFQPAEETGEGGAAMCADGMMDRFANAEVYALHCDPQIGFGEVFTKPGPLMAAVTDFVIHIDGVGGHGAVPQRAAHPVAAALAIGQALMTIAARNLSAHDAAVLSLTQVHAGTAPNIIPATAVLGGTIRTFDAKVEQVICDRMQAICEGTAAAMGVKARLVLAPDVRATINDPACTEFAIRVAQDVVGAACVITDRASYMAADDFSVMLKLRPDTYLHLGQGRGLMVHETTLDFNDDIAPIGAT